MYRYVGPCEIAARAPDLPAGTPIHSAAELARWIRASAQRPEHGGYLIATYVVNQAGELLIADRRSEHVACAGRLPVQSAGEITFLVSGSSIEVASVSNQSTGYCPEPESWPAVAAALRSGGFEPPPQFEPALTFRRCPDCEGTNVVKNNVFQCALCSAELPDAYNCQT